FLTFERIKGGTRVNQDTIFEIGASTMALTACLLADMVGKKEVRLGDPISKYLPAGVRVPSYRGQEITLLDLANHTPALPRIPANFLETVVEPANPCKHYSLSHLYAFLSGYQLRYSIGWRRVHSNLGM